MTKLFIDCDTGIDDSLALLFALKRPDVRVTGITASCGNTTAAQAAENTLRILRLAEPGYEVPVAIGAEAALDGTPPEPIPHIHGRNGIGNVILPAGPQKPLEGDGVDFLIDTVRRNKGDITLVMLGRLTDAALALEKEPELPRMVKRLVVMGGTLYAPGNVGPMSEANIKGDAAAADRVLRAGFALTLTGLDVTTKVRLTLSRLAELKRTCAPASRPAVDYLLEAFGNVYIPFNRVQSGRDDCPVHDPLAMLAAVEPGLFTGERLALGADCTGGAGHGRILPLDGDGRTAFVPLDVDADAAVEKILSVFY